MSINATLLGQMLVFALLIWFTMTYVWPVLLKAMEEREAKIADGLAAGEKGRHELDLAEIRATKILRDGKDKAAEFIAQVQKRADEMAEEAKENARAEGERLLAAARAQMEQERNQARESLRREVSKLALIGAEQILMREVDAAAHSEVLEKLSAQL
ncbi:MAG: F0F1 ATP synthase subunit B [Gammaproteobacteria bacterium]